jgi:hypothetical protein
MIDLPLFLACGAKTDNVGLFLRQMHGQLTRQGDKTVEPISKRLRAFLTVSNSIHIQPELAFKHPSGIRRIQMMLLQVCCSLSLAPYQSQFHYIIVDAINEAV